MRLGRLFRAQQLPIRIVTVTDLNAGVERVQFFATRWTVKPFAQSATALLSSNICTPCGAKDRFLPRTRWTTTTRLTNSGRQRPYRDQHRTGGAGKNARSDPRQAMDDRGTQGRVRRTRFPWLRSFCPFVARADGVKGIVWSSRNNPRFWSSTSRLDGK